jgi:hypothetical protein
MKNKKDPVPTYWDIKEKVTKLWNAHVKSKISNKILRKK